MADARDHQVIAADYREARERSDAAAMRRHQNEEACFVLLAILGRLAADVRSFVHEIALKGGILMAGELRSTPIAWSRTSVVPAGSSACASMANPIGPSVG